MQFVIMDLEWNNTYGRKTKSFINEVIEIGAVMLDDSLNEVDRYSSFIKAQIGKKLRGSVKELTHITNEDISGGVPFTKAMSELRKWIGSQDTVVLSWGDGDIRVLIENYRYLNGIETIPFLRKYVDLQRYFQNKLKTSPAHQVGLGAAAEMLGIDVSSYMLHRAIDDCVLTAECFRRLYEKSSFDLLVRECGKEFYDKLSFKPYVISNLNNSLVDKSKLCYICEQCGEPAQRQTDWRFVSRHFRAMYYCPNCDIKVRVGVCFKKHYDHVEVKKTSVTIVETPEESAQLAQDEDGAELAGTSTK